MWCEAQVEEREDASSAMFLLWSCTNSFLQVFSFKVEVLTCIYYELNRYKHLVKVLQQQALTLLYLPPTPFAQVYSWFLGVYKVSKIVGIAGYVMLLMEMFGASALLRLLFPQGLSIDLIWWVSLV